MKSQSSFKERKKHGSSNYSFKIYDIISDRSMQFAINHFNHN